LQCGIIYRVKALNITLRIAAFLTQKKPSIPRFISPPHTMGQTDLANLSKGTDIPLNRNVSPVLSDIRHNGERARIDVPPAKMAEWSFGLAEDWLQVA
jgi:hypothetical protein